MLLTMALAEKRQWTGAKSGTFLSVHQKHVDTDSQGNALDLNFVDQIYEAAAIPELWGGKGVLDKLAEVGACSDGIMFSVDPVGKMRWLSNDSAYDKMQVYERDNWVALNPYLETQERIDKFNEPKFLLDREVIPSDEMAKSPYYRGFMRPYQCYWHAGTSIIAPSGDTIKLSVHRSFEDGPLPAAAADRLTAFRPHLARASLIAARLRFEQIRATLDALDTIGFMAAAVKNGRLTQASKGFQQLVPTVVQDRRDKIAFVEPSADKCWTNLIGANIRLGGSFPIPASEKFSAVVVHVLPIAGAAHDVFGAADLLIAITEASPNFNVIKGLLISLYDLTPAEVRVAEEIAAGRSVASIARIRNVSVGTVRAQLHAVFEKTGTQRQADLTRLVTRLER